MVGKQAKYRDKLLRRSLDLRPLILVAFAAALIFYSDIRQAVFGGYFAKSGEKASEFMTADSAALNPAEAGLAPFYFRPIDVNTASAELLMTITGIGPVLAADIIKYREKYGHIAGVADLMKVKGIGEKRAKRLGRELRFEAK